MTSEQGPQTEAVDTSLLPSTPPLANGILIVFRYIGPRA